MQLQMFCAYNETRECFLGLEVTAGDFPYQTLSRKGALIVRANEGLWLRPFRGIPESGVVTPLDLIFLDSDCRVIDVVESFPANRIGEQRCEADSLLVLPAHSIFSSDTQRGDQFVLCVPDEMQRRLERLAGRGSDATTAAPRAALTMVEPHGRGTSRITALMERPEPENLETEPERETQAGTHKGFFSSPRNWLQKLWSSSSARNRQRAPRLKAPDLAAYYWDGHGVPPTAHEIRDISSTGLFLLTGDRWYEGTLILMSLENKDDLNAGIENVISVNARVVRADRDGVGLQFLAAYGEESGAHDVPNIANRKKLEEFLQRVTKRKQ